MRQFYFLGFILCCMVGCITTPPRPKTFSSSDKIVKPVSFEARNASLNQFKPRVLVLMALGDESKVPMEWSLKAEKELWNQLERLNSYVLLKPTDVGMNVKEMKDLEAWDWSKIHTMAREKSIPLVMEWELLPIQMEQDADPVGMIRERRRTINVHVKARLMDSRKASEILSETGTAQQKDKDILWLSRQDGKMTVADYDKTLLEELLKTAVENLAPALAAQASRVSWTGRVAMIKGDRIYLNVGRQSGLQVGDILKVLESGEEVFDPETGQSIGKVPGRMKGTLEVVSYFGQDGTVAVIHSGAGFQENDSVEYY